MELLKKLPVGNVKQEFVDCGFDSESDLMSKILGLRWSTKEDVFFFPLREDENLTVMRNGGITKRRMLRMVMQIFDPLGFLSFITIRGRYLVHVIWRHGYDWDVKVGIEIQNAWKEFEEELKLLGNVKIPRQFAPVNPVDSKVQLVVFVDASDKAYCAVAYLRFINDDGSEIHVGLARAKARLRGSKYRSIPKMELDAALCGVRIACDTVSMLSFKVDKTIFLSDAKTVLSWISSTDCKFAPYVEPRIAEIWDSTTVAQWFYVPTKQNVADEGTKWTGVRQIDSNSRWFKGPEFLLDKEENWPVKSCIELKNSFVQAPTAHAYVHVISEEKEDEFDFIDNIDRYGMATWIEFLRAVALETKKKFNNDDITIKAANVRDAQVLVFRKMQSDSFSCIVEQLKNAQELFKEKKIKKCEYIEMYNDIVGELKKDRPFIDDVGLMRMRARYQSPNFSYDRRNPPILPPKHPLVVFLVKCYHERNFHCMDRATKGDLAEFCWIHKVGFVLKGVKSRCESCIRMRKKAETPLMGDLHFSRVDFGSRPWIHVGVDAFGPYDCKYGRGTIKRWAFIFTDLTYRAVHVEMVNSMSTDHCMLAIRNFIGNRNVPLCFYSDNGTNYRGAHRVMHRDFVEMQQELGEEVAKLHNIEWQFIPAASPWMGGSWERLIQSIKSCLEFTLLGEVHEEEVLRTTLTEISFLMNRRPLTEFPADPSEGKPVTPNSMLIGDHCNDINLTCGIFGDHDVNSPLRYRRAEHLTKKFMQRFIREYLPTIARREKWTTEKEVKVGDTAFLVSKDESRRFWKKVEIVKVHPGRDGVIRVVDYKVPEGDKFKTLRYRAVGNLVLIGRPEASA